MGTCGGKPVIVHESILEECFQALGDHMIKSENELNSMKNKQKIESTIKLHARTLADHLLDTQNKLKDAVCMIRQTLMKRFSDDYGVQWAVLIIIEVMIAHTKGFAPIQKASMTTEDWRLDADHAENDHLNEQQGKDQAKNKKEKSSSKDSVSSRKKKRKIRKKDKSFILAGGEEKIIFFNENLLRFESEFVEIALTILDSKKNPFFNSSVFTCLTLVDKFSSIHKDFYTADKINLLIDYIQGFIISSLPILKIDKQSDKAQPLSKIDIDKSPNSSSEFNRNVNTHGEKDLSLLNKAPKQNQLSSFDDNHCIFSESQTKAIQDLSKAFMAYSSTLFMTRSYGVPFSSKSQSEFFLIILNQLGDLEGQNQFPKEIRENALQVLGVFSKRCFTLKKTRLLINLIFSYFDQTEWKYTSLIQNILDCTLKVANTNNLCPDYFQEIFNSMLDYLQSTIEAQPEKADEIDKGKDYCQNEDQLIQMKNCQNNSVRTRVLQLIQHLTNAEYYQSSLFEHSIHKIMCCFLHLLAISQNQDQISHINNDAFMQDSQLIQQIKELFLTLAKKVVTDSASLFGFLLVLIIESCDFLIKIPYLKNHSTLVNGSSIINPNSKQNNINNQNEEEESHYQSQQNIPPPQLQNQEQNEIRDGQSSEYYISCGREGLKLMELALQCLGELAEGNLSGGYPCEDVIGNLVFMSNFEQLSVLSFKNIANIFMLRSKVAHYFDDKSPRINNEFSQTCILQVLYGSLKNLMSVGKTEQSVFQGVLIAHYTSLISQQLTIDKSQVFSEALFSLLVKLINETGSYSLIQFQNTQLPEQEADDALDQIPQHFNSTSNGIYPASISQRNINNLAQLHPDTKKSLSNQKKQFQRHQSCFNIIQVLASELISVLIPAFPHLSTINLQLKSGNIQYTQQLTKFGSLVKELLHEYNQGVHISNSKISSLCKDIYSREFIDYNSNQNPSSSYNSISQQIARVASESGISSHFDFDRMTAQFARKFTTDMKTIHQQKANRNSNLNNSAVNYGINSSNLNNLPDSVNEDPSNTNHNAIKNNRSSNYNPNRNSNNFNNSNNNNNNNSIVMSSHSRDRAFTNETEGNMEKEDPQFQNILGMIKKKNVQLPQFFADLQQFDTQRSYQKPNQSELINHEQIEVNIQ